MKFLGLDLGTKMGHASWDGRQVKSGIASFALKRGDSPGMRYHHFNTWLREKMNELEPDIVVYEAPHHRGGAATEVACGFSTRVQEACALTETDHTSVHTATLKLYATGNGRASKAAMRAAAIEAWPGVIWLSDDHVDARWVLAWTMEKFGETVA